MPLLRIVRKMLEFLQRIVWLDIVKARLTSIPIVRILYMNYFKMLTM